MKSTRKTKCKVEFPQAAIDAWAAVLIDVANKLDQADDSLDNLSQLPATGHLEQKSTAKTEEPEN